MLPHQTRTTPLRCNVTPWRREGGAAKHTQPHNHHIKSSPDSYPTNPTAVTMTNNTQEGVPMATMARS